MIQRIQSVWLMLAAAAALLLIRFPVYSGNRLTGTIVQWTTINATATLPILMVTVAIAVLALVTLFLYSSRKLQMRLCIASVIACLVWIALFHREIHVFNEGDYSMAALLLFAVPLFFLLAIRGMVKDEKLIKSADRLR